MQEKHHLLGVLQTLARWWRPLFLLCLVAGVLASIIVLVVPVYYQSTTTFFVASPDQAKPELLFGRGQLESEYYGTASDIDRVMTIANSEALAFFLIDSFGLYDVYDIDIEDPKAQHKVLEEFAEHYLVEKTKRDAIELSVEDESPQQASAIANAARQHIDFLARQLIRSSQLQTSQTYQASIDEQANRLKSVGDSLARLRSAYGIYNVEAQTETLTAQQAEAEAKLINSQAKLEAMRNNPRIRKDSIARVETRLAGLTSEVESLNQKLARFNEGIAQVELYVKQYAETNQQLSLTTERNKQLQAAANANIPAVLLVEAAKPPVIKHRPKRTITVLASVMAAFLFGLIGIFLFENYRDLDWQSVWAEAKSTTSKPPKA